MQVQIDAAREVPGETPPLSESYIPRKYSRESELTLTVEADGENSFSYDLEGRR